MTLPRFSRAWTRPIAIGLAGVTAGAAWWQSLRLMLFGGVSDESLTVVAWLALAVGGTEWLRQLGWPPPPGDRLRAWVLPLFGFALLVMFHQQYMGVTSDGRDYFVQARSIAIDHDFAITDAELSALDAPGQARHYPIGTALLWAPGLAATHAGLGIAGWFGSPYPRTGTGGPYAVAAGLTSLALGFAAVVLIARMLGRIFRPALGLLAALTVAMGTFLLWYLVAEASMSHAASFFAVTLFLYLWHEAPSPRTRASWIALGAAGGLMAVTRWQDALFGVVVIPEMTRTLWFARRDRRVVRAVATDLMCAGLAAFVVVLPQLRLWQQNGGGWLGLPTGNFAMNWTGPDISSVLFSPLHGLTTWSPLTYLAMAGLVPLIRHRPRLGLALSAGLLLQLWVNGAVEVWWGGSSFGARRLAGCGLVFAAGLAALFDWGRRRPVAAAALVCAPFVLVNALLVGQVRGGDVPLGHGVTAPELLAPVYALLGNPFSFPANARLALEHGVPWSRYDELGRQVFQRLHIDVGEPDDARFLSYGWSAPERSQTFSFRWTVGPAAGVIAPLSARADYEVGFRAEPWMPADDAPPSHLTVLVNGHPVGGVDLHPFMREYRVPVPRAALVQNLNHVRFEFSRVRPGDAGQPGDTRPLAVSFDWIDVSRARD